MWLTGSSMIRTEMSGNVMLHRNKGNVLSKKSLYSDSCGVCRLVLLFMLFYFYKNVNELLRLQGPGSDRASAAAAPITVQDSCHVRWET